MRGISAIVATYKRDTPLKRLFDSLVSNRCDCLEIIVVDQNKDNLIDGLILEYQSVLNIKHFRIDVPNQSHARNYGSKYATYPILCFPDDDCWFDNDSINKILDHFELNKKIDLLLINWRQSPINYHVSTALDKNDIFSYKAPTTYSTYVMFFNKNVFFDLGFFQEAIGIGRYIGSGEDTELIFRAAKNNLFIYFDANIYVNHKYTPYTDRDLQSLRSRQRGSGFIYRKYRLSYFVISRGLISPFFKMMFCMDIKKAKTHYNIFIGRIEGFLYAAKREI